MKLRQTSLLRDYILEFRRLANRTRDISPSLLKSCFIGGLKLELRHDAKILKPKDVLEATVYAQQLDAKLLDLKVKTLSRSYGVTSMRTPFYNVSNTHAGDVKNKPDNVCRLTPKGVEFCRKNGLCFHYKEKYNRGHSCEKKQLLLIDIQEPEETAQIEEENLELEITACALFGIPAPKSIKTMKVCGMIKNCSLVKLIDSRSSHNFIDLSLVKRIRGQLDTIHSFNVKIANGGKVTTMGTLGAMPLKIQNYQCITYLYAMALSGCDIVLGVQWLRTLGPVLWDFDKLYMTFQQANKTHCISSLEVSGDQVQDVTAFQMKRLLLQEPSIEAILFQLEPEVLEQQMESVSLEQQQQLQQLLQQYEVIFLNPSALPPHRSCDHIIPLIEGSRPPCIRPYRYGPLQKTEIENCVQELLTAGLSE